MNLYTFDMISYFSLRYIDVMEYTYALHIEINDTLEYVVLMLTK